MHLVRARARATAMATARATARGRARATARGGARACTVRYPAPSLLTAYYSLLATYLLTYYLLLRTVRYHDPLRRLSSALPAPTGICTSVVLLL